ncbi:hypothetical protein BGZ91_007173, partial [Linnemannia elongata]
FVRSLHEGEEEPIEELPFSFTQFGAVLMVDIVGFSQMTSIASSKGDVGAEMLASQIGAYFDLAIRIIEFHGGDVVKFLGDALLVVFQQDPTPARVHGSDPSSSPIFQEENPAATLKRNKIIVRKAIDCGMELLARLSNYRIYLSEREYSRKLSASSIGVEDGVSSEDSSTSVAGSTGNGLPDSRRSSLNALGGANGAHTGIIKIGNMTTGPAFSGGHLGTAESPMGFGLTSGLIGPTLVPVLNIIPPAQNNNSPGHVNDQSHIGPGGIAGFRKREGSVVSFSTKAGSTGSNKHRPGSFLSNAKNLFTHANSSDQQSSGSASEIVPPAEGFIASDDSHDLQLHMALSAGDINSNFPAQFRNVTILFISLGDVKPWLPEGLAFCQKAMITVHRVISAYEGFIQQFAVDDKGATLLCAFGLPYPRSHEKEAVFAAKSAWMIRQGFLAQGIHGFKISLATGVIFTSMIGNEFRRDPAIVGDTIVIAVRILKFDYAKDSIVLDDATRLACTTDNDELCEFEDRGEEFVKGKTHPLRIWRLVHFGAKKQTRRPEDVGVDETIGYEPEREKVVNLVTAWAKNPNYHTILVTGPRGSGKSMFYHQMIHMADNFGYRICSAASAEVEKNTEYYPVKFLLLGLLDIMRQCDIPYCSNSINTTVSPPVTANNVEQCKILPNPVTIVTGPATYTSEEELPLPQPTIGSPGMLESKSGIMQATDTPTTVSYISLDRRRASNISVDLNDSPSISQYGEPSARRSASMTKLEAYINVCLTKIGEKDMKVLPKLNKIISDISSDNAMPLVDEHDDNILANFIVDILNYASRFVKIIVMFEDLQFVLFSRPQRDYGGNIAIQGFTNHPHHLEISLEGLKRREIELALIKTFSASGVTRVSPEVLELVQQRTKGNPKFVKDMATMLKDFCHVNIVDGELLSTGQEANTGASSKVMEEMVMKQDRKRTTLMQYDRLRPRFQDFVKIASCLGDRFSLAEIAAIRPLEYLLGTPQPGKSYANVISDLDTYRFLSMATDQQTNVQFSNSVVLQTIYTFGSPSTARDIYDSIPYEERVGYHLKMGQFYESFLEQGYIEDLTELPLNGQDLLPQITRHYLKTEHTEKKIKYLKALSAFDLKSNMLTDTTQNINELIFILDTEPGAREMVSQEDLADIYGIKGESLSKRMRIEEAEPALLESLAYYGIVWPQTRQQWKMELLREGLKFKFHHFLGETPVHPPKRGQREPKARVEGKEKVRYQRIIRVLYCLQNIYFWLTHPGAAMLSSLYTLKYSRKLGLPSGIQTASLGRMGLLYYFQDKKRLCEKYMNESWAMDKDGQSTEGMLPAMSAYVEYSEGRLEEAHRLLVESIQESKTFSVFLPSRDYEICLPDDCQLLRTLSAVAIQNGDSEGETLFAIPTLSNLLLQDRLREAESWVVLIEKFIMPKARLMNLLIVHGILGYYYARLGQYEKSRFYLELFGDVIEIPAGGAHPFPVMSCMFSLMSLYEMLENGRLVENDAVNPSTFLQTRAPIIIEHILNYLKNEPAAPIPRSYSCLGEGLMSLLTPGREKEGTQRLVQGYRELSGLLDGLHFVKAYLLARVGRYCPDPAQKEIYYREAHELFSKMSMDSSVWLSDPNSPWIPPARTAASGPEEHRRSFIRSDIPTTIHPAAMEVGTLGWAVAEAKAEVDPEVTQQPLNRNGSGGVDPPPGIDNNQSGAMRGEGWGVDATELVLPTPSLPAAAPSDSVIAPWADEEGARAEGEAGEGMEPEPEPEPEMNLESYLASTASWTGAVHEVHKYQNFVALDEGPFDYEPFNYELATAARATGPTVHDINGGSTDGVVNPTVVEFNGLATQGQVM